MNARTLPLDQVLPGAVLADNIQDDTGRVLLRVGTLLTESAIEALRRRDIPTVSVELAVDHSPEHLAIERLHLEARLQTAFRHAGESEARRLLWQALVEYKLGVE